MSKQEDVGIPDLKVVGVEYISFHFVGTGVPDSLAVHLQKAIILPRTVRVDDKTKNEIKKKLDKQMLKLVKKGKLYRDPLDSVCWIFVEKGK